jgi:superfamily II DNA or RNA helicase
MDYGQFIGSKLSRFHAIGFEPEEISEHLFDFQSALVRWALRIGRCALFADTGLGKTRMQLAWADAVLRHHGGQALILAPLAVAEQTREEGEAMGIEVRHAREQSEVGDWITITNYERLHKFDTSNLTAVILDESSIIKHHDSKSFGLLTEAFAATPYKLCATATPAPNDWTELGTHAEFLGVCSRPEMLAEFFVHDAAKTQDWRLKGHARTAFWEWVASWAAVVRNPSDIGFDGSRYELPPLNVRQHTIETEKTPLAGQLFANEASTLSERRDARRKSINDRVLECAELVNKTRGSWVVWCDLNDESDMLTDAIDDAIEVRGSQTIDEKESALDAFRHKEARVIVTKPSIAGFGLNWQHCANMAFVGVTDSYESYYQAVRRCWRFGQKKTVNVHVFSSDLEGAVVSNLKRKEESAKEMAAEMVSYTAAAVRRNVVGATVTTNEYTTEKRASKNWTLYRGDCVEVVRTLPDHSIGYSIFSPPFASLYTYSNSPRDMGNSKTRPQFMDHFGYLVDELRRVMQPGRDVSFHCMLLPTSKVMDGVIGLHDFRGELIRCFESRGFIYHSEVVIWKDPVTAMQRTKALGLLHKTVRTNSSMARQGIPDYLVTMRAPGDPIERVTHDNYPVDKWQQIASPVWMDINPSDTLQYRSAREHEDERHIAPLQLEVIRRGIELWTNPGDTVLSPFAGIGSEGHVALDLRRKFIGVELKRSYFEQACQNLANAEAQGDMFDAP